MVAQAAVAVQAEHGMIALAKTIIVVHGFAVMDLEEQAELELSQVELDIENIIHPNMVVQVALQVEAQAQPAYQLATHP